MCTIAATLSASSVLAGPSFRRPRRTSGARATCVDPLRTSRVRSFSRSRHAASPFVVARVVERSTHSLTHSPSFRPASSSQLPTPSDDWTAFEEAVRRVQRRRGQATAPRHREGDEPRPFPGRRARVGRCRRQAAFKFLNAYEELHLSATIECLSTRDETIMHVMKKATKENPHDDPSWETTPFAAPEFANWSAAHPDWTSRI